MSKYNALRDYLNREAKLEVTLDFAKIEDILGSPLPRSAYEYPAWWSEGETGRHVQNRAWFDAGYSVESFNLNQRHVTFRRNRR